MPLMFTDSVNQYFSNIGDNLASVIPTVNSASFRSFLGIKDYPPVILGLSVRKQRCIFVPAFVQTFHATIVWFISVLRFCFGMCYVV